LTAEPDGIAGGVGRWLRLAGTLIALVLLFYLLSVQGWDEIWAAIVRISPARLLAAVALTLVSRVATAGRWHALLRSGGIKVSFAETTRLTFAGLFASNFLPTTIGGDVVRLAGALQRRLDPAVSTASLIADRLVGMAGMALALPLAAPALIAGWQKLLPAGAAAGLAAGGGLPARLWAKLLSGLRRVWQAVQLWLRQPRALLLALGFTGVHMLCTFGSIALFLDGMGQPLPLHLISGLWSAVYFITLFPISINGYGLQEISTAAMFTILGGVSQEASLTVALLLRTITILASLPGAAFVGGILERRSQPID
jgi:hypothetical protein